MTGRVRGYASPVEHINALHEDMARTRARLSALGGQPSFGRTTDRRRDAETLYRIVLESGLSSDEAAELIRAAALRRMDE